MLRRGFWMAVGAATGVWMVLRVQRAASRLTPSGAAEEARRHVRHLRTDLAAALAEGRRAKQATEAELRQAPRARRAIDVPAGPALPVALPVAVPAEQRRAPR